MEAGCTGVSVRRPRQRHGSAICMYVYMYVCVYIYIYIYIYMLYLFVYLLTGRVYSSLFSNVLDPGGAPGIQHIRKQQRIYVCIYISIYIYIHILFKYLYIYIYICIYIYIYTYSSLFFRYIVVAVLCY